MNPQVFGGKTLMKWREPHALLTRNFVGGGFCILLLGLVIFVIKSMRETGHPFAEKPAPLFLIIVGGIIIGGLAGVRDVRLKELHIAVRGGWMTPILNYNDIETAVVQEGTCNFEACTAISFKLKPEAKKSRFTSIAVPSSVDLDQIIQIFRDKGVGVENQITGETFG